MSYVLPTFNLNCGVWTGPWVGRVFRFDVMGNLALGRRVYLAPGAYADAEPVLGPTAQLLLPPLTDIRDWSNAVEQDLVEVPALSGRWYCVIGVDDAGKGFPNEHRVALLAKIYEGIDFTEYPGLFWPTPIP